MSGIWGDTQPNPDCAARLRPHGPHELASAGGGNKPGARCAGLPDPSESEVED